MSIATKTEPSAFPCSGADVRIAAIERVDAATWRDHHARCATATFFESPAWSIAWNDADAVDRRPAARLVHFDDGASALLPLTLRRTCGGLVRHLELAPGGTAAGFLSADALGPLHVERITDWLCRRHRLDWRVSPYHASPMPTPPGAIPDTTRALRLDAPLESLRRRWTKGHRAAVRQAERAGVRVRCAEATATGGDLDTYERLYRGSLARWGERATSRHPRALFDALVQHAGSACRLWLAEIAGEAVAGAICLEAHRHVAYWHGAAAEHGFKSRPVHALVHAMIEDAVDRGAAWFDFNPSGGHAGVDAFKKGFGTESLPAPLLRRRPGWARVRDGAAGSR